MATLLLTYLTAAVFIKLSNESLFPEKRALVEKRKVCKLKECEERAQAILSYMNLTADPCEDFYSYACGRHIATSKARSYPAYSEILRLQEENAKKIEGILKSLPNITEPKNATETAIMMYQMCMHSQVSEESEIEAVRELLEGTGYGEWPLPSDNRTSHRHFQSLEHLLLSTEFEDFFGVTVMNYPTYGARRLVAMTLGRATDPSSENVLISLRNNLEVNGRKPIRAYENILLVAARIVRPKATYEQLILLVKEAMRVQTDIEELMMKTHTEDYMARTIKQFENDIPSVPILKFLNAVLRNVNFTLNYDDTILMKLHSFKHAVGYLSKQNLDAIYNYAGILKVVSLLNDVSKRFNEEKQRISQTFKVAIPAYTKTTACRNIFSLASDVLSRLYVLQNFDTRTKEQARHVLKHIGGAYFKSLQYNSWMDRETRNYALEKLWKMKPCVGFSDTLMDEKVIDSQIYNVKGLRRNDSLTKLNYLIFKQKIETNLRELTGREIITERTKWEEANAYYWNQRNQIVIPAGLLQSIIFGPHLPMYLNFGSVGMPMGHEITHGFDITGSKYDGYGKQVNWWTEYTRQKFQDKANCFERLYANIVDPVTNMSLNGNSTLSENMADNVGIRVAYNAYRSFQRHEHDIDLPGLENFTSSQLFFVSFALPWCSHQDERTIKKFITTRIYSPHRYRVNVPLMNSEEFSAAFHCKKGSRMRLPDHERCVLW